MNFSITFIAFCLIFGHSYQQDSSVIIDSNVPNVEYELAAVQAYYQSILLYPNESKKQLAALATLYNDAYPTADGWKVAEGCTEFFNPSTQYFILMNVTKGTLPTNITYTVVRLFN
ncbi:unnamed protein product [Psylliodes chrysocephalus]|uniref:Uncharacterized protein n=1 Tax=Psylliodes chrysocephalus TaxID=3402493 RepID=A0A9P0D4Q3_9CUCU|nr:unnamed protein product [Psylliodes chrysocephala]